MDVSLISLQSGVATASLATDAALPEDGVASIDFSTLLALGMNPDAQGATPTEKDTEGTAEIAALPAHFAQPAPESLIALPQPLPFAHVIATTATLPRTPAA